MSKSILKKIAMLARNPYNAGLDAKSIEGRDGYRLRHGDMRVLYQIHQDTLIIDIMGTFKGSRFFVRARKRRAQNQSV